MPAAPHSLLQFQLFGKPEMRVNGILAADFRQRETPLLTAYLLLSAGRTLTRSEVLEALWPNAPNELPARTQPIRHALGTLRRCLGSFHDHLVSDPATVCLNLLGIWADVVAFDLAIARKDAEALEYAVSIHTGALLDGFGGEWVARQRDMRHEQCLRALESLAAADLRNGHMEKAERRLDRVIEGDSLRASAWSSLLKCRADTRARQGLDKVFARAHRRFTRADVDPSDADFKNLTDLYQQLRSQVSAPSRRTVQQAPKRPRAYHGRTPIGETIGRDRACRDIGVLLDSERLVTLTGPAGVGKTRLAQLVGAQLGYVAWAAGEAEQAQTYFEESLLLLCESRNAWEHIALCDALGSLASSQGDYAAAERYLAESRATRERAGDHAGVAGVQIILGGIALCKAEFTSAWNLFSESRATLKELGKGREAACALINLSEVALAKGDLPSARDLTREATAWLRQHGDTHAMTSAMYQLGLIALYEGDIDSALVRFTKCLEVYSGLNQLSWCALVRARLADAMCVRGEIDTARAHYAESLKVLLKLRNKRAIAESLEGIAKLEAELGNYSQATRLLGAANAIRQTIGAPCPTVLLPGIERTRLAAQRSLDIQDYAAAWEDGSALTWAQAVAVALKEIP